MSNAKGNPIENASEVIERFGGIRPMAKKIEVAVTTVQGWKKRDVIPAGRREAVLQAAETYSIDLTDIMADAPATNDAANENVSDTQDDPHADDVQQAKAPSSVPPVRAADNNQDAMKPVPSAKAKRDEPVQLEDRLAAVEEKVVGKNTWAMIVLVVFVLLAVAAVLLLGRGSGNNEEDRLAALEARTQELAGDVEDVAENVEAVEEEQKSFFGTIVPADMGEKFAGIQEQAGQAKEQLGEAVEKAKVVSNDVLGEDAGTIEERAVKLEGHLQEITGSPVLAGVLSRVQAMTNDAGGQGQIDQVMLQLNAMVANMGGQASGQTVQGDVTSQAQNAAENTASFEDQLDAARAMNPALENTFAGVPKQDLKAAAMLLAMTQFRSTLNRDNAAFEGDFDVLMGLVGEEDVALRASLEKLAPHAEQGVLTPAGLKNEFKTIAGDAVVASLTGEDVSLGDRTKARMNDLFQVEKDGELITGTETQAVVAKADTHLEQGDLAAAIATVQTLDGPAATSMSGWLKKAQATLAAQNAQSVLTKTINLKAFGLDGLTAATGEVLPGDLGGGLTRNEETGINIYKRNKVMEAIDKINPAKQ